MVGVCRAGPERPLGRVSRAAGRACARSGVGLAASRACSRRLRPARRRSAWRARRAGRPPARCARSSRSSSRRPACSQALEQLLGRRCSRARRWRCSASSDVARRTARCSSASTTAASTASRRSACSASGSASSSDLLLGLAARSAGRPPCEMPWCASECSMRSHISLRARLDERVGHRRPSRCATAASSTASRNSASTALLVGLAQLRARCPRAARRACRSRRRRRRSRRRARAARFALDLLDGDLERRVAGRRGARRRSRRGRSARPCAPRRRSRRRAAPRSRGSGGPQPSSTSWSRPSPPSNGSPSIEPDVVHDDEVALAGGALDRLEAAPARSRSCSSSASTRLVVDRGLARGRPRGPCSRRACAVGRTPISIDERQRLALGRAGRRGRASGRRPGRCRPRRSRRRTSGRASSRTASSSTASRPTRLDDDRRRDLALAEAGHAHVARRAGARRCSSGARPRRRGPPPRRARATRAAR